MTNILNDFIKQNFGGKSICELAQIEQKLQDTKELLKWIDKCSTLEGKLLKKDEQIEKLTYERDVYHKETSKNFHALRLAVEDMETLKPKGKMCVMSVLDEETAVHCSGRNDCDDCLFWFYTKRAMSHIEMIKSAVHDEIEGRKRMDAEDTKKAAKDNITLESLDDIVRRAEGLGREMEEKMRR